tara:strand:- start:71 stop:421 length:351 start_codon:yes stop_codon:yes gene_type:complete
MSEEKKFVVTPPKPKPSALTRGASQIKYGVKNVGAGIAKIGLGTIKKAFPYRKPQNIETPESMESVFMKAANKKFKENAPLYRNRQSAINKTKRDIKKDPSLNKMMKKLKKQKNID